MTRRGWLITAAMLAVGVHVVALYLPATPSVGGGLPGLDKLAHLLLFAVPVWLVGLLSGRVWLVAGLFAGHAVVSELVQHWLLPQRSGDPLDLLADLAGVALGVAGLRFARPARLPHPGDTHRRDAPSP